MESLPTSPAHGTAPPLASFYFWRAKVVNLLGGSIVPLVLLAGALNPGLFWWARVLAGLAFAVLAALLARITAMAVIAWPDRLVIRNLRNTHVIPWAEIDAIFQTPRPSPKVYLDNPLYTQATELLVRLRDGSIISATVYSSRFAGNYVGSRHDPRRDAIARLNELQRELSPVPPGESPA
jgi:hypothetical protein